MEHEGARHDPQGIEHGQGDDIDDDKPLEIKGIGGCHDVIPGERHCELPWQKPACARKPDDQQQRKYPQPGPDLQPARGERTAAPVRMQSIVTEIDQIIEYVGTRRATVEQNECDQTVHERTRLADPMTRE